MMARHPKHAPTHPNVTAGDIVIAICFVAGWLIGLYLVYAEIGAAAFLGVLVTWPLAVAWYEWICRRGNGP